MGLLKRFIISDLDEIAGNGVRLKIIGDYKALSPDIVAARRRDGANGGQS
jgi:undecaprenyl diphosphate synthase